MELDYQEIALGKHDDKIVWICDFRYNDMNDKPIRHVQPTRVKVRRNSLHNKKFYYSNSHFVKLKPDDTETSTTHALFDNTGFRSRTGMPLLVFTEESECKEQYRDLIRTNINKAHEWIEEMKLRHKNMVDEMVGLSTKFW